MKNATKGALAAAAAGSLLLGGAGSLAYWTDTGTVSGKSITSGHLSLGSPSCAGWKLNGTAFSTQKIVPGDQLTQSCTYTISADGDNLTAAVDVTGGGLDAGNLTTQLTKSATVTKNTGTAAALPVSDLAVVNGDTIKVDVTVTFPTTSTALNAQSVTQALSDITVTAKQTH
jgi:alternate signal-mediated exported protein